MQSKSAEIYVFSGTGNTFSLVESIASILNDNNLPTTLRSIPGEFFPAKEDCALGLAFTTACFASYPFVTKFVRRLPKANGREAFLISSLAGSCLGMPQAVRRILVKKGYIPIGCCTLKMPSNYGKNANAKSLSSEALVKEANFRAANFAGKLLTGKTRWEKKFAPWASFFFKFSQKKTMWSFFRKFFPLQIHNNYCTKCGFCKSICPNDAIEKSGENYFITNNCVSCQRCAAYCPENAIGIGNEQTVPYKLVEYKDMLAKINKNKADL